MNIVLFDDSAWQDLLPLTFTRPVAEIRVGILTISEKWRRCFGTEVSWKTQGYLSEKYPENEGNDRLYVNGSIIPDQVFLDAINRLQLGQSLEKDGILLAKRCKSADFGSEESETVDFGLPLMKIQYPWQIFENNAVALKQDFEFLTKGKTSAQISHTNTLINQEQIFLEEGAKVECAVLNASKGPIYIGKDAEVMEGATIRGPLALCEHSAVKMGAKIYGPVTIGPHSKVGGEVGETVIFGYSNKGHDGYLGNAVLGEWCNLGADTNNSNLKNNYAEVKLWNYGKKRFIKTGLQFCGLIMGDHSKSGINTMFNTGTVVGVSANIFGSGFPRNFVPSFAWGGAHGFSEYATKQAFDTAKKVMARRGIDFDETEQAILNKVFEMTQEYRRF